MSRPSESAQAIIAVGDLRKTFGHVNALQGLNFTVNRGDIYGFLGPNGSGKSTTIRILMSLINPDSGTVNLFDQSIKKDRRKILPRIGALIERPDFYGHFSAYKNLHVLNQYAAVSVPESSMLGTLELVGLKGREHDAVNTYSDGMKQRLGIAQALMHNPELIILDEPFNSLDPQGVKDIRDLIVRLNNDEGVTILVSSHKLDEIEKVATRMVMINRGKAIAEGSVLELINEGTTAIKLVVDNPETAKRILQDSMHAISRDISRIEIDDIFLVVYSNKKSIPTIINTLVTAGIKIFSVADNHSLEELFLSLTSPS